SRGTAEGPTDAVVVRYDATGGVLWEQIIATDGKDVAAGIASTADGGFVLSGTSGVDPAQAALLLGRLDPAGELLWWHPIGFFADWGGGEVCERPDGGFVMAACTESFGAGG